MISLFLDTSSSNLNVGVLKNKELLKEKHIHFEKDLSKYALNEIKELLDSLNLKPNDIDNIYCVNGPGSFTGLRIGVTIAKTFAWGLNKDLYKVSSLFAMATSITHSDYIIPLIDARRNYVFTAIYDKSYNVVMEEKYISKDKLLNEVNKLNGTKTYVATTNIDGFDVKIYEPDLNNLFKYLKDDKVNIHTFVPNYLKQTEAEENLNK